MYGSLLTNCKQFIKQRVLLIDANYMWDKGDIDTTQMALGGLFDTILTRKITLKLVRSFQL